MLNRLTSDKIISVVCADFGTHKHELQGHCRMKPIPEARRIVWTLMNEMLGHSKSGIAKRFNRDHSTVIKMVNKIKDKPIINYYKEKLRNEN